MIKIWRAKYDSSVGKTSKSRRGQCTPVSSFTLLFTECRFAGTLALGQRVSTRNISEKTALDLLKIWNFTGPIKARIRKTLLANGVYLIRVDLQYFFLGRLVHRTTLISLFNLTYFKLKNKTDLVSYFLIQIVRSNDSLHNFLISLKISKGNLSLITKRGEINLILYNIFKNFWCTSLQCLYMDACKID